MTYHCVVIGCTNGSYKLKKWQQMCMNNLEEPPFKLYPIPTAKKKPEERAIWLRNINRLAPGSQTKLFDPSDPSKDARVCSEHFKFKEPTNEYLYPTENLGYNFEERSKRFSNDSDTDYTRSKRRKGSSSSVSPILPVTVSNCTDSTSNSNSLLQLLSNITSPSQQIKQAPLSSPPPSSSVAFSPTTSIIPLQVNTKQPSNCATGFLHSTTIMSPSTTIMTPSSQPRPVDDPDAVDFDVFVSIDSPEPHSSPKLNDCTVVGVAAGPSTSRVHSLLPDRNDDQPGPSTSSAQSLFIPDSNDQPGDQPGPSTINPDTFTLSSPSSPPYESLKNQATAIKNYLNRSFRGTYYKKLIKSDKKCNFYTNIESRALFEALFKVIWPYAKKRYERAQDEKKKRKGGRKKTLPGIDEMLMTMMKLKLGLYFEDLGDRFGVSIATASRIFNCWVRALSLCLKSLIFMPDEEVIRATLPSKFSSCSDVVAIIDCSEIFIETPKDLELQAATWSEYKHHNTIKFLISTTPNSFITFVSEPYTGRISDKAITNDSGFLDTVPSHTRIMADKGFNIQNECAARLINFLVPPGRRGSAQMTPAEVKTTTQVGKLRILVEQIIRRVKTFRIIAEELPISLLSHLNDILIVCCGLSNLKGPIIKDRDI